ncbi:unnamed protein product [Cuscuta campestris]|uniref:Ubiquitin-like protease family profile domain-containing protein n=1 Tax=Cuscuta campestris TaxID=132261 RepID=A0A484LZJ8_9ASTE|nr:unnamed protein product [Cuscuta campestris]
MRRSARLAMATNDALRGPEQPLTEDDALDELPLSKRMEKVQDAQKAEKAGLLDGRINTYCNVNEVARQIRGILTPEEVNRFRASAFGVLLDVLDCPWISGQLLIHLFGNCVRSADGAGMKDVLKFRILGNEVVLTKAQFHLITGLKMGGMRGSMENGLSGRFASRYFRSSKSVKRREISNAFLSFRRDADGSMPIDALNMYLFYPWGDDVWRELVDHVYRCAVCIEKGGSTRPTFGGFMFALQVWAFETFPALAEDGMCVVDPDRVNAIPRCLKWKVCSKLKSAKVSDALLKYGKLEWAVVEPADGEMLLGSVRELFRCYATSSAKGKGKLSLSDSKRARNVKEKQVNIREALGKMKVGGMASGAGKREERRSVKLNRNYVGRRGQVQCVAGKGCDHLSLVKEIADIKEKQVAQDRKLDEILGILRLKSPSVEVRSASGKASLMGGNEEVKEQMDDRNGDGNAEPKVECANDVEMCFDAGGPSFDLLTPMPKGEGAGDDNPNPNSGSVSVTNASGYEKEGKCVEIPFTETRYDTQYLELIDGQTELMLNSLQNAKSVVGQDVDDVKCNVGEDGAGVDLKCENPTEQNGVGEPVSAEAAVGGYAGSNKGKMGQHSDECRQRVNMGDDDFERIFTSSNVASGEQGVRGVHGSVVAFTTGSYSNSACVDIERPKRVHKNPDRYTPSEAEQDKKKRKIERMERARERLTCDGGAVCFGPFSEDPKQMPADEEIEKVRVFLKEGILKRQGRGDKSCRYTSKVENMTNNPIVLDGFNVENKTWIYELFTNTEWLRSTHVEIAMYFLEVKGRQYNHLQMYTTTSPYFLQGLHNHQELINVGRAKKEDVINNLNLTSEVKGLAREYARPWSECDFVYMPLNTGDHWLLLVLEVEGRTIRVYDSKGKKGKICRALNTYVQCITELLPVLLDMLNVYDEHSDGPMGKRKFCIKAVDGCPQQNDGCNCGMFMLKFSEYLMMDRDIIEVHSRDMEAYRVKITTELMVYRGRLLHDGGLQGIDWTPDGMSHEDLSPNGCTIPLMAMCVLCFEIELVCHVCLGVDAIESGVLAISHTESGAEEGLGKALGGLAVALGKNSMHNGRLSLLSSMAKKKGRPKKNVEPNTAIAIDFSGSSMNTPKGGDSSSKVGKETPASHRSHAQQDPDLKKMEEQATENQRKTYADVLRPDEVQTDLSFYQFEEINGQKVARLTEDDEINVEGLWDQAVICYILGANPPLEVVKGFITRIWKEYVVEDVSFHKEGQYIVQFQRAEERDEVIKRKYYYFDNKPMLVQRWKPGMNLNILELNDIPIWVQLPNLDMRYWCLSALGKLGSILELRNVSNGIRQQQLKPNGIYYARLMRRKHWRNLMENLNFRLLLVRRLQGKSQ